MRDRCRVDDPRQAVEAPQLLTGLKVVAGQLQRAGHDHLLAAVGFPDDGRGVAASKTIAGRLPDRLAGGRVDTQQEAVEIVVFVQQQLAVHQHRRTGRTEFILKRVHRPGPEWFAGQVVAQQTVTAEHDINPLAIAGRRAGRGAAGGMIRFEPRGGGGLRPTDLAGRPVQRHGVELLIGVEGRQIDGVSRDARAGMSRCQWLPPEERFFAGQVIR